MKFIDPGFKGNNPGHYSTAVVSNGMLYVSGLLSMDPDTREVCTGYIPSFLANTNPAGLSFRQLRFTSAASLKSNALPNSKPMTDSN